MKKYLVFGGGVITGFVLAFIFAIVVSQCSSSNGVTLFDAPGEIVNEKSFEVFQVLDENAALTHGEKGYGAVYLLTNSTGKYYYDDEVIIVPDGKVVRQIGIYQYETKNNFGKTVPIVEIMDK
ncbi:MAG: hypothetical protein J1E57_00950 [Prevotella sp.]|nr:hypothetical protein [Prevotella sp.]